MTDGATGYPAGSTILLVDDEEGVRRFCRRVLESEGAQVVEAHDGAAALLSLFRPDLPVLGISADPGAEEGPALRILRKPFTSDELVQAVAQTRQHSREIRTRAEEKRKRAHLLQEASIAAQAGAHHLRDRIDLVAAAIALRRLNGESSG